MWCIHELNQFSYYLEEKSELRLLGSLNFDLYHIKMQSYSDVSSVGFQLSFGSNSHKKFYFRSPKDVPKEEFDDWLRLLQKVIFESKGSQKKLAAPGMQRFWNKYKQISIEQFMKKADTFDVILYQSDYVIGSMVRKGCKSDFDHVDLCIKLSTDPDDVFLLSANSKNGVHIKRVSKVLRNLGKFYTKMVYRHLEFQRTE